MVSKKSRMSFSFTSFVMSTATLFAIGLSGTPGAASIDPNFRTSRSSRLSFEFWRLDDDSFPKGPHAELTPGSLCENSRTRRYPEGIKYCSRSVHSDMKREIIRQYDREFGYEIGSMRRGDFKIDHYIPLCAGGSNNEDNLWPQHESVYAITDPLEPVICEKMSAGRLQQAEAVDLIKKAKNDLTEVPAVLNYVRSL